MNVLENKWTEYTGTLRLRANLLQIPLTCGVFHLESVALLDHEADDPYSGIVAGFFFFLFFVLRLIEFL